MKKYHIMFSIRLEYIWIDNNYNLRSKIKVIYNTHINDINDIPEWNYDGSSTQQAVGSDSEVIIKPRRVFSSNKDPYHMFVLCDTYTFNNEVLSTNNRAHANLLFNKKLDEKPWFGIEQEYFLIDSKTNKPLGYDKDKTQGQYYCSVGAENAFGRQIAEEHLLECIDYGIKMSGINAEVAPGQWEYQVGPCEGIEAGDHLWMARYLLQKITEKYGIIVNMDPKPLSGDWNGSGCHTNYSTKAMREGADNKTGLYYINQAIDKLSKKHIEHMEVYGSGNELRMTGKHETASYHIFTHGTANRGASVRIGNTNLKNEKGYFEDRRPSSNCDPYLVISKIFETTVL
jgi:glutamine synthetase